MGSGGECPGGEGEPAAVEVGEFEVGSAGEDEFGDVGLGDADAQVVVYGPKSKLNG